MPFIAHAQAPVPQADLDWRGANEAVAQFKRGHADVLKWEQTNLRPTKEAPSPQAGLPVPSAEEAVRQAWRPRRELAQPMRRLGSQNVDLIAAGRWHEVEPTLQRLVHIGQVADVRELFEIAADARKAWISAVAARQVLKFQREALVAAEAASELGQRMVKVGNWSPLQQTQMQIALTSTRGALRRAEYAAAQPQLDLLAAFRLTGVHSAVDLPESLPELPAKVMSADEWQRLMAIALDNLPRADRLKLKASAQLAFHAYQASHALAFASRDILKVRAFVTDETVLHYNGMLKSVWDVLTETRNQSQAFADAIMAQRDFLLAEADLQLVLQGIAPARFISLGGDGGKETAAAGH